MTSKRPFLSFLGVRYALVPEGYEAPPGWTRLARGRGADLLENAQALPRAFVPSAIYDEPDHARRLAALGVITDFRAWGVVGLEAAIHIFPGDGERPGPCDRHFVSSAVDDARGRG